MANNIETNNPFELDMDSVDNSGLLGLLLKSARIQQEQDVINAKLTPEHKLERAVILNKLTRILIKATSCQTCTERQQARDLQDDLESFSQEEFLYKEMSRILMAARAQASVIFSLQQMGAENNLIWYFPQDNLEIEAIDLFGADFIVAKQSQVGSVRLSVTDSNLAIPVALIDVKSMRNAVKARSIKRVAFDTLEQTPTRGRDLIVYSSSKQQTLLVIGDVLKSLGFEIPLLNDFIDQKKASLQEYEQFLIQMQQHFLFLHTKLGVGLRADAYGTNYKIVDEVTGVIIDKKIQKSIIAQVIRVLETETKYSNMGIAGNWRDRLWGKLVDVWKRAQKARATKGR